MYISIELVALKVPGFKVEFTEALTNFKLMNDLMWGVQNISQFIGEVVLSALIVLFLGKRIVNGFKEFKKNLMGNIGLIVGGFLILLFVSAILNYLYEEVFKITGTAENQLLIEAAIGSSTGIFMILTVVFLAPFVEEIIYRDLMFGILEKKFRFKPILAVIISAALFAALHAVDVFFFQYFAMGLILSGSYSYSRNNIFIPMGIHFLNNASVLFYVAIMVIR
jgi:membrane protease YdiL (CAAX protease family)